MRKENCEFRGSLGYIAKLSKRQKKTKQTRKNLPPIFIHANGFSVHFIQIHGFFVTVSSARYILLKEIKS
jgi:hypothetical protein